MTKSSIHKEHRLAGQGAILLCALLWSTSGLFIKLLDWHPVTIAGGRSILAALFLIAIRFLPPAKKGGAGIKINPKEIPALAAAGLCYAATMILFVYANKLTASANAIVLQYTSPVWAALLGWLVLGEKPRRESWFALALVSVGMLLVFSDGLSAGALKGDIIALLSGITFGANSVVLRRRKDGNPADILIFSHIITVIFSALYFFLYPPSVTAVSIISITFMGIFQIGMASALFVYGIKRIPAVQAMLTATIEPVLNPLWVLVVTGERPAPSVLTGGAVIIGAVVVNAVLLKGKQ